MARRHAAAIGEAYEARKNEKPARKRRPKKPEPIMPADLPTLQRSPMPRQRLSSTGGYGISTADRPQSALMLRARMTLPHFSVSSAISLPNSADESASTSPPRSANCALILGSARPALISLLSLSTMSAGVAFGAPTPSQKLAS